MCCRTCRQKVGRVDCPDGTVRYAHPGNQDGHAVEAVMLPAADTVYVCDFCLAPDPTMRFPLQEPASTVLFHPGLGANVVAEDTDSWWGACSVCAVLIRERKIGQLRDRALAVLRDMMPGASWEQARWARESVMLQLAAFWQASPGDPVEVHVFS